MVRMLMLGFAALALASALAVGISTAVATTSVVPVAADPILPAAMAMNMREVFPH